MSGTERGISFRPLTLLPLEVEVFSREDVDELEDRDDEDPESDSEEEESLDDDLCRACFSSLFASLALCFAVSTGLEGPLLSSTSSAFLVDSLAAFSIFTESAFSLFSDMRLVVPSFLGLLTSVVLTLGWIPTAPGGPATTSCSV